MLSLGESHSSSTLPPCWSCLPALALPDGAHQHDEDSSFFLLPSKETPGETVFGISCYRQIETKKLKVKDKDVTRDTVQKSVVLISTKPVFGVLKVLWLFFSTKSDKILGEIGNGLGRLFRREGFFSSSNFERVTRTSQPGRF